MKGIWLNAGLQIASASVDGVVKVWNLKKQQCVNTIEMSEDKIWTMDLHEEIEKIEAEDGGEDKYISKIQIITGGSDATLRIWKDYTAQ